MPSSIKQIFQVYLLEIAMKSIEEDFQQAQLDARILLSHAEGALARGSRSIGNSSGPVHDQLYRSVIERTRGLHTLNKEFEELLAVGAGPEAFIKLLLS